MIYRCDPGDPEAGMIERDDGEYVEYEYYEPLRKTLEELTTAVESECMYDTVLRKALSPYFEAARKALEGKDDD